MARSRLFEHAQETLRLMAVQARKGHTEGVRKRTPADDRLMVRLVYQATLQLVPEIEEHGDTYTPLRKGLTLRQYRLIADLVRPAGWLVSRYHDTALTDVSPRNQLYYYLHTQHARDLSRTLRRLSNGTLAFEETL